MSQRAKDILSISLELDEGGTIVLRTDFRTHLEGSTVERQKGAVAQVGFRVRFDWEEYGSRVKHVPSGTPNILRVCGPAFCSVEMMARVVAPRFALGGGGAIFSEADGSTWPHLNREVFADAFTG